MGELMIVDACEDAHKLCAGCGEPYPATKEFYHVSSAKKDGLDIRCKECAATYSRLKYLRKKRKTKKTVELYDLNGGYGIYC